LFLKENFIKTGDVFGVRGGEYPLILRGIKWI